MGIEVFDINARTAERAQSWLPMTDNVAIIASQLNAFVGAWPIADDIAQRPDGVILAVCRGQNALQGHQVGVNIG
jgi:hypothetical protein